MRQIARVSHFAKGHFWDATTLTPSWHWKYYHNALDPKRSWPKCPVYLNAPFSDWFTFRFVVANAVLNGSSVVILMLESAWDAWLNSGKEPEEGKAPPRGYHKDWKTFF